MNTCKIPFISKKIYAVNSLANNTAKLFFIIIVRNQRRFQDIIKASSEAKHRIICLFKLSHCNIILSQNYEHTRGILCIMKQINAF